jgi:hypothetical protein
MQLGFGAPVKSSGNKKESAQVKPSGNKIQVSSPRGLAGAWFRVSTSQLAHKTPYSLLVIIKFCYFVKNAIRQQRMPWTRAYLH